MTITKQIKDELKSVKNLFDTASKHLENEKVELANYYENKAKENVDIYTRKLSISHNLLIDLIFDFDYTVSMAGITYKA